MSFCVLITVFFDQGTKQNIGLLFLVLGFPMMWNLYRLILDWRKVSIVQLGLKEFKSDEEVQDYLQYVIALIENLENPEGRIELEGILKYHSKSCPRDTCYCRQLLVDETKEEEGQQALQRKWYMFVQSVIEDSLEKFVKSPRLHLMHSYILHEKLKNKFKALFELMIAHELRASIQEEFSMHRFSNQIGVEIKETDEKNDTRNVDVNKIVLFQKRYIEFQASIDRSVLLHLDFWRELLESNPEIHKIENMGSKITATVEEVRDQFRKLKDIYSSHIKCLEIYGFFLKDIVNDDVEGEKILDNVKYAKNSQNVNKQFVDQERLKYGENSNTAIITVSGNLNSIGVVTNLNNELARILGWTKSDVIDQNISKIMPKIYADLHDQLMQNYFDTSEAKIIGFERTILCLNKDQFLVPCTLMIKVLPNLEDGIQTVGFLKDIEVASESSKGQKSGAGATTVASGSGMDERVHYMIYRVDNDSFAMQGVTQSCFQSFGIPSSLMYGNNSNNVEFTVDSFCPELTNLESFDDMKSPQGVVLTIDTTMLKQNFLFDEVDSEDEDEYQYDNDLQSDFVVGNSTPAAPNATNQESDQNKPRRSKYRKAKVRMYLIQEQSFQDITVHVVKFSEVDEFDEGKSKLMQEGLQGSMMDQNNQREYEKGLAKKGYQQQQQFERDDEFNASDRDSNFSNVSVNDEVRKLKDFKSLISEKTVPQSINILKKTVLASIIVVVALSGVELMQKTNQQDAVSSGIDSIRNAYLRPNIMADISFYTRRVSNIANSIRLPSSGQTQSSAMEYNQGYLGNNVKLLQTNQFDNMKDLLSVSSSTSSIMSNMLYDVKFQQQMRIDVKTYQNLLTDAMIQLITSSSSLAIQLQASFVDDTSQPYVDSTLKDFYYVMTNGLFVLRKGTEYEASTIYDYYYNKFDDYESQFRIILIVAVIMMILSIAILIPYVFKVHKTNNRVLSLFGMIHIAEIKNLATRCESYSIQFIEDKMQNGEPSQPNLEDNQDQNGEENQSLKQGEESNIEIDGELNENDVSKGEIDVQKLTEKKNARMQNEAGMASKISQKQANSEIKNGKVTESHLRPEIEMEHLQGRPQSVSQNGNIVAGQQGKVSKIGQGGVNPATPAAAAGAVPTVKPRTAEEEEADNLRSQKLMNAKDNNRKRVIGQFLTFALVFIAYFVIGFVIELSFLQNMRRVMSHLKQVSQRSSIIKYCLVYLAEEVTRDVKQMEDGTDNLWKFVDLSYSIESQITSSGLESYPGSLDSYFAMFKTANYDNFCEIFPETSTLKQSSCKLVNSGILEKGLKISITSYIEDIRKIISNYLNTGTTDLATKQALFASNGYTKLEEMQFFLAPMIDSMNAELISGINSYLTSQGNIENIKFGLFLAFIIVIFIGVWMPYLKYLSQKIWRTKGMLNMIPMDIITKDQNLKKAFASGDIMQAVR